MDETTRLNALRDFHILDTEPSQNFDRITRLAANAFGAKIALVSLVDEKRQWFKSSFGMEEAETSRDVSFCAHAIEQIEVMVVLDATKDPRFANNPLVTGEPHIAFYAGAQLRAANGAALGTLCVIDDKPREEFGPREREMLADLAESTMAEIENNRQADMIDDLSIIAQELRHRMGNMYAQLGSLVSLMADAAPNKDALAATLREKIGSLSQAQTMLSAGNQEQVALSELADGVIRPLVAGLRADRVEIQAADDLQISSRGAFIISLLLNELSTNALKHGALHGDEGQVHVNWRESDAGVELIWKESSRNAAVPVKRDGGFGLLLLEELAPAQLKGAASFSASEDSLIYRLSARADQLLYRLDNAVDATGNAIMCALSAHNEMRTGDPLDVTGLA